MPSGATHDRITLTCLPIVSGVTLCVTQNAGLTLCLAGSFLFSGLMFGPDLDIHSVQFKRWGVLRWIWKPYQKCLRHRSWLSHGPIIGTTVRLLYLVFWIGVVGAIALLIGSANHWITGNWTDLAVLGQFWMQSGVRYSQDIWAILFGLELGAMSHSLSDSLGSAWKRRIRKRPAAKSRFHP